MTEHPKEVTEVINRLTMHGATEMDVIGTYKDTPRSMIYSVIDADELRDVLKDIREEDPAAFVNVMRTDQLSGHYYMRPND